MDIGTKGWIIIGVSAVGTIASITAFMYYYNNTLFYERYEEKSADGKMADLWDLLVPNENKIEGPVELKWSDFDDIFTQDAEETFDADGDRMPEGRKKTAHTHGLIAKVSYQPTDDNFISGMFETGSENVIMRLSEAGNLHEESSGLTPSVALKFLVDGDDSQNVFGMHSFLSSGSWNWYENRLSNRVVPFDPVTDYCADQTKRKKNVDGNEFPFGTGVAGVASHLENGNELNDSAVSVPYELSFEPPEGLETYFSSEKPLDDDGNQINWYDQLRDHFAVGDTIYKVTALTAPEALGGERKHVANLILKTTLRTSEYGDDYLFFQHFELEDDMDFWPSSWVNLGEDLEFDDDEEGFGDDIPEGVWPEDNEEAKAFFMEQERTYGCPFAWLLDDPSVLLD